MKTKKELSAIKEEVETLNKKLAELTDDELNEVAGGYSMKQKLIPNNLFGASPIPAEPRRECVFDKMPIGSGGDSGGKGTGGNGTAMSN